MFGPKNAYFNVLGKGFNSRQADEGTIGQASWDERGREVTDTRRDACNPSSNCSSNANLSNSGLYSMQNESYTHDTNSSSLSNLSSLHDKSFTQ